MCVKNADKVIFKVHRYVQQVLRGMLWRHLVNHHQRHSHGSNPSPHLTPLSTVCLVCSAEANPSNLVELLTEGLDRKLHLDRFKRTLARIPTRNKSARPHSAPSGGRRHHRQSSSMRLSIDSAEGGDELAYLALTADGPMTTPRTVKLLKGSKKMEEKEVGDEKEGEKDAFDKPSHCPTSNKLKGLTPSASEVKGVGAAKAKEQHIQVSQTLLELAWWSTAAGPQLPAWLVVLVLARCPRVSQEAGLLRSRRSPHTSKLFWSLPPSSHNADLLTGADSTSSPRPAWPGDWCQVPTLKRLQSLPTVLDGLSKPGFSPRDPDQVRRRVCSRAFSRAR